MYPLLAFLFIQSVLLLPGQVQRFDLLRCRVSATLRAPSSFPVNRLPSSSLSSSLSMSPRYRHCLSNISPPDPCSHPFSGFMAPPFGFSVFSSVSVSAICSVFSASSSFPAQPGFLSASPFIPISVFLSLLSISGVLAAQPASSFLVASVYSTVVLLSTFSITPPRLTSDLFCPSQLLPFFNLYSLSMARLRRFGFLFYVRRFRPFLEPSSLYRPCIARYPFLRASFLLCGLRL